MQTSERMDEHVRKVDFDTKTGVIDPVYFRIEAKSLLVMILSALNLPTNPPKNREKMTLNPSSHK